MGIVSPQSNTFSSSSGEALRAESTSTISHTMSIVQLATTGAGAALNVASTNVEFSCTEISGVENGKGTLKISHTNKSGTANGDANAAMISLESHVGTETGTAVQGIAFKASAANFTGAWLSCRDNESKLIFRVKPEGFMEFKEVTAEPAGVEAGMWGLYVKEGKLFIKIGAAAGKEITIL